MRIDYAKEAEPVGTIPPPATAQGAVKSPGQGAQRARRRSCWSTSWASGWPSSARGRGFTRPCSPSSTPTAAGRGGPSRQDLVEIRAEEHAHFTLVEAEHRGAGRRPHRGDALGEPARRRLQGAVRGAQPIRAPTCARGWRPSWWRSWWTTTAGRTSIDLAPRAGTRGSGGGLHRGPDPGAGAPAPGPAVAGHVPERRGHRQAGRGLRRARRRTGSPSGGGHRGSGRRSGGAGAAPRGIRGRRAGPPPARPARGPPRPPPAAGGDSASAPPRPPPAPPAPSGGSGPVQHPVVAGRRRLSPRPCQKRAPLPPPRDLPGGMLDGSFQRS